jgi:serine protease inhibitor
MLFILKQNWSSPFPLASTRNIDFYKTATDIVKVDALQHFEVYFNYYESPHLKAEFLELPFKGNEASMMIVFTKRERRTCSSRKSNRKCFRTDAHFKNGILERNFTQI